MNAQLILELTEEMKECESDRLRSKVLSKFIKQCKFALQSFDIDPIIKTYHADPGRLKAVSLVSKMTSWDIWPIVSVVGRCFEFDEAAIAAVAVLLIHYRPTQPMPAQNVGELLSCLQKEENRLSMLFLINAKAPIATDDLQLTLGCIMWNFQTRSAYTLADQMLRLN